MRKFFMILTLAISYMAATGAAHADGGAPPTCGGNCPWGPDGTGANNGDPVR